MNFCEDSSSGLEAKRKELLVARLHGHDTHFIRRIPACSGDGQCASASPRSPLTAPCQHGWGGARSLRHASEGEGPSREASPLCSRQKTCFRGTATRAPATRRQACGTTGRGAGRYLLVPAALRRPSRLGRESYLAQPGIATSSLQPATGLQAVTRGYWGSTSTYGHTHTSHTSHTRVWMHVPCHRELAATETGPRAYRGGRDTAGGQHTATPGQTARTRCLRTARLSASLSCSAPASGFGRWRGDDNQASHEGHSHT